MKDIDVATNTHKKTTKDLTKDNNESEQYMVYHVLRGILLWNNNGQPTFKGIMLISSTVLCVAGVIIHYNICTNMKSETDWHGCIV